MSPLKSLVATALCCGLSLPAWAGAKVEMSEDQWVAFGFLMQPEVHFVLEDRGADPSGLLFNPQIRRARAMIYGQLGPKVSFFTETETSRVGLAGNFAGRTFLQDAYVELQVSDALQIDVGLLLLPWTHHGYQAATTLMGINYNGGILKHPANSTLVWRDTGVMFRGMLADNKLEYRLAVTNGVQRTASPVDGTTGLPLFDEPLNGADLPRTTLRVTYNIGDHEGGKGVGGMFVDQCYLKRDGDKLISPKKVIAIGGGASFAPGTTYDSNGDPANFLAFNGDVVVDIPLGDATKALSGQVVWVMYDQGDASATTGMGVMTEWGFRVNKSQPLVSATWFDTKDDAMGGDHLDIHAGYNYYLRGHSASVKTQVGMTRNVADPTVDTPFIPSAVVQTQIVF